MLLLQRPRNVVRAGLRPLEQKMIFGSLGFDACRRLGADGLIEKDHERQAGKSQEIAKRRSHRHLDLGLDWLSHPRGEQYVLKEPPTAGANVMSEAETIHQAGVASIGRAGWTRRKRRAAGDWLRVWRGGACVGKHPRLGAVFLRSI